MKSLAQLIQEIAENGDDDTRFRADYSGRGMYGRQCVGIVGDSTCLQQVIAQVIKDAHRQSDDLDLDFDDVVDALLDYSEDSMGRDRIFYWPSIQMAEASN